MGYVEEMRGLIGSRPLMVVGAVVIVRDEAGRVLLRRRADGRWALPGGDLQPGEAVEDAARRAFGEGSRMVLGRLRLRGVASGPELADPAPAGPVHHVMVAFIPEDWEGLPGSDWSVPSRFFHLHALPEDLHPPDRHVLARFGAGG